MVYKEQAYWDGAVEIIEYDEHVFKPTGAKFIRTGYKAKITGRDIADVLSEHPEIPVEGADNHRADDVEKWREEGRYWIKQRSKNGR